MMTYGTVFVLAVTIGFAATLLMRGVARRAGVVDEPDGFRKTQGAAVPLLGGVGIFVAFCGSLLISCATARTSELLAWLHGADTWFVLGGAAAVLLLGLVDDVWGLRSRWKLLGMFLVSVAMYVCGFRIGAISNPFGPAIQLGWLAPVVTVFWFLGCMNAINLIDGLDGLAAGVTVFAAGTVLLVGAMFGNPGAAILATALAGATLGFLLLNFHPASIYLGDCGSLLLGFLLACIGLKGAQKSQMVVALFIPVIALGLPVMDTALAILRRWLKALPFACSDRQHIHHKLLEMGLSHRVAVLLMYGCCLVLAQLALLMSAANGLQAAGLLVVLGLVTFLAIRTVGRHEYQLLKDRVGSYVERRRKGAECRAAAYMASASMRNAHSMDELWQTFVHAAHTMELDGADLVLTDARKAKGGNGRRFRWRNGSNGPHEGDMWAAVFALRTNGTLQGRLSVRKATNGLPLRPEIPESLQLLTKALSLNIDHIVQAGSA